MRYIFVPAFASFFLFSSVAPGETITNESVIERDGLYYKKGATEPFTGKIANDLNHDKILGKFKHGKRDGLWEFYHPNGQLRAKGKYKDGKYHGYWEWYFSDGRLESKGPFKDGKYEGYWVNHYNNNQLRWEGVYSKGKRVGPWVWFYSNGGIVEKSNYMYEQPGVRIGQRVKYHQNGQLMEIGYYRHGRREGSWVFYEENGAKRFYQSPYGDDQGTGIYRNGIKISE